jgi:uncharacterized metal-binding protein
VDTGGSRLEEDGAAVINKLVQKNYLSERSNDMEDNKPGNQSYPPVLLYACSGAADVGAVADQAARKLSREGIGRMHCLAGIGGGVPAVLEGASAARKVVAIDGCKMDCAKMTLARMGIPLHGYVNLASLGMVKGMSPVHEENVEKAAAQVRSILKT